MIKENEKWEEDVSCEKKFAPKKDFLYSNAGAAKWKKSGPIGKENNNELAEAYIAESIGGLGAGASRKQTTNSFRDRKYKQEDKTDWSQKYIQSQKELVEEAAKWSQRFTDIETYYKKKLGDLQMEFESTLEEGYAEAYEMLCEQRDTADKKIKQLEAELATYKANYHPPTVSTMPQIMPTDGPFISER